MTTGSGRGRRAWRFGLGGLLVLGVGAASIAPSVAQTADEPAAGQAGTDTSLPETESAVTRRGSGPFEAMEFTVNQTANLFNQAVSVTWTGGEPTVRAGGATFAEHFVQIMQCWSKPGTQPQPEQCEFGATDGIAGGRNAGLFGNGFVDDRVIAQTDFALYDDEDPVGVADPDVNWRWLPFAAVTGETVDVQFHSNYDAEDDGEYWLNTFFNLITTNEIPGGRTRADGTGEELFEVQTGQEANGLGCGQAVFGEGESAQIPDCWLVIVPRGSAADENRDTIEGTVWEGGATVMTSPLAEAAWEHRIVIPLEFNPVDSPCDIDAEQRRIVGSELVLRAVRSWQPALCSTPGLPPYGYTTPGDGLARRQILGGSSSAPGMAITPAPIPKEQIPADDIVVFAPLTLSSVVVGFNLERVPDAVTGGAAAEQLAGVRVAELNLTPRLVAKLLTQSYQGQVNIGGQNPGEGYEWAEDNPSHLGLDEDFAAFNPEFKLLAVRNSKNFSGLVVSIGTSDAARMVWDWISADPEASAWLAGEPDEFGMRVNPAYNTTAEGNSFGVPFGDPVPDTFPKAEPFCFQADPVGIQEIVPTPLCGTDWMPYATSLRDVAQRARAANDGARTFLNVDAVSTAGAWRAEGPQFLGSRAILSMVDSSNASLYGLQMARLSRAGDNGADREFVAADAAGMTAGLDAMVEGEIPGFLVPDPEVEAPGAYPLTVLNYAAVAPLGLDEQARDEYASFIDYAVGDGQESGLEIGQLPPGYTELPPALRDLARAAATLIREATAEPPASTTTTTATTTPPTTAPPRQTTTSPSRAATPPTTTPQPTTTTAPAVVVTQRQTMSTTTTTAAVELGVTPASAVGGIRFALPFLGGLALLATLAALEITKRPRRSVGGSGPAPNPAGATNAVIVVLAATALAVGVAAHTEPAAAQDQDLRAGDLELVEVGGGGGSVDGGGSATDFAVRLAGTGTPECPGDSANEDYRLYSFMVPTSLATEDIVWDGLGPTPRSLETYEGFRQPLFDTDTNEFTAGLTAANEGPGEPGLIVQIPDFSLGVYREEELPTGDYRIGIACVLLTELARYWDAEITVAASDDDPSGFEWQLIGARGDGGDGDVGDGGGGSSSSSALPLVLGGGAVVAALLFVFIRRRSRPATPPALEQP